MVKSKLPPRSGFGLEAGEPHPQKWAIKFFFFEAPLFFISGETTNEATFCFLHRHSGMTMFQQLKENI